MKRLHSGGRRAAAFGGRSMKRLFAAAILLVAVASAPSASVATTLQIQSGRITEDTISTDTLGGVGGPAFSAVGIGPAKQIQAGGAFPIGVSGGLDFVSFQMGSPISVAGFGSCLALIPNTFHPDCFASLQLTNPGFTAPPPLTDFTITVPFTATGTLGVPGAQFDLVGSGFLTFNQQTFFLGQSLQQEQDVTYSFVVPELSTLPLAVVGVALGVAASLTRRRHRRR
jgi:hypothetical protein